MRINRNNRVRLALAASQSFWKRLLFPKQELFRAFVQLYERYEQHAVAHTTYVREVQEAARRQREE
jgi:hypothetical protein